MKKFNFEPAPAEPTKAEVAFFTGVSVAVIILLTVVPEMVARKVKEQETIKWQKQLVTAGHARYEKGRWTLNQ